MVIRSVIIALAAFALGACSSGGSAKSAPSSGAPPTTASAASYPRQVDVSSVDARVREQLDGNPKTITEVAPGVYERPGDQLLLGNCPEVNAWIAVHGKPHGSICFS